MITSSAAIGTSRVRRATHPLLETGDRLSLPIGTGAMVKGELGPFRERGHDRNFIPRNAPEIFNRGSNLWFTQYWDSRISEDGNGGFVNPAGSDLPEGMPNVLAVQAMFPVTSRDEMRGAVSDGNELAAISDDDFPGIWNALVTRLLAIDDYRDLFTAAFNVPDENLETEIGFEHAATAIAAFEAEAFTFLDSPFDQFLAGNNQALSTSQKRGAVVFYGKANCSQCHSGPLLTDQKHYNLLVPHIGPGKVPNSDTSIDMGRFAVTMSGNVESEDTDDDERRGRRGQRDRDDRDDRDEGDTEATGMFCFRTPPLRNVEVTGPYMHNGVYSDLKAAVRHHLNTVNSFAMYDPAEHLDQKDLISTVVYENIEATLLYTDLPPEDQPKLSRREFDDLTNFLKSLTAPQLEQRLRETIPPSVPSGLPLDAIGF